MIQYTGGGGYGWKDALSSEGSRRWLGRAIALPIVEVSPPNSPPKNEDAPYTKTLSYS